MAERSNGPTMQLNDTNFVRFDAKLEKRLGEFKGSLLAWIVGLWLTSMVAVGGMFFELVQFRRAVRRAYATTPARSHRDRSASSARTVSSVSPDSSSLAWSTTCDVR